MPKANPKAAALIREIGALVNESMGIVANAVEVGRMNFADLIKPVDNIQRIIDIATDLDDGGSD